jgi:hypothetical protein
MRASWKLAVAFAGVAALGAASVLASGVVKPGGSPPPTPDTYATEVARERALLTPARQAAFLQQFNSGARDFSTLPIVPFDTIDWAEPLSSSCLQANAQVVGQLVVTRVQFQPSNQGDLPSTHITYEVEDAALGLSNGQEITAAEIGGPYLALNNKEEFIQLPYSYVQRVGDHVLAFFSRNPSGSYSPACPGWSTFKLNADGTVADQPGATEAGLAGKAASAVLSAYAAGN